MKTIILTVDLLIGTNHELAGKILDASDELAKRLIERSHASLFDRDAPRVLGSIETASRSVSRRKAVQLSGKAV